MTPQVTDEGAKTQEGDLTDHLLHPCGQAVGQNLNTGPPELQSHALQP